MKARPILFSGPMVQALLEGRKTQTRRLVKPQPAYGWALDVMRPGEWASFRRRGDMCWEDQGKWRCPYGQPGDLLWVRETWAEVGSMDPGYLTYRATYPKCLPPDLQNVPANIHDIGERWHPSIHMPRRASRLTLPVAASRVERLNDISEADARDEGAGISLHEYPQWDGNPDCYRKLFKERWKVLHGPNAWAENPWVWVVEFSVIKANVDQVLKEAA